MDVLLVIDMQNGVCENNELYDRCVEKINQRILCYREADKPIIFIQHNDESLVKDQENWKVISEISQVTDDIYIQKYHANSFYHTNLQEVLLSLNVTSIEMCGAQTEYCVDATIKMAHGLGYELQMLSGATLTFDNKFMSAKETVAFYENIWNKRFLNLLS